MEGQQRQSGRISRRSFLDRVLTVGVAALGAAIAYPIVSYLIPPKVKEVIHSSVVAAKASEIAANSGKIFLFANKPAIVLRAPTGEVRAFTAVCTHLACTVQYRPDLSHIWCACHDGHYDLHGQVLSGPPPRPLEEYRVTIQGDDVIVSKG